MEWKKHVKAILKDAIANPPSGEALDEYLDKKVEHILSYVPETEKVKREKSVEKTVALAKTE